MDSEDIIVRRHECPSSQPSRQRGLCKQICQRLMISYFGEMNPMNVMVKGLGCPHTRSHPSMIIRCFMVIQGTPNSSVNMLLLICPLLAPLRALQQHNGPLCCQGFLAQSKEYIVVSSQPSCMNISSNLQIRWSEGSSTQGFDTNLRHLALR